MSLTSHQFGDHIDDNHVNRIFFLFATSHVAIVILAICRYFSCAHFPNLTDVFQIDRGNRKLALELTVSRRHLDALDRRLYFAKNLALEGED